MAESGSMTVVRQSENSEISTLRMRGLSVMERETHVVPSNIEGQALVTKEAIYFTYVRAFS